MCRFTSDQDSLVLELCREHGPSLDTYSLISQILQCHSANDVRSAFMPLWIFALDSKSVFISDNTHTFANLYVFGLLQSRFAVSFTAVSFTALNFHDISAEQIVSVTWWPIWLCQPCAVFFGPVWWHSIGDVLLRCMCRDTVSWAYRWHPSCKKSCSHDCRMETFWALTRFLTALTHFLAFLLGIKWDG